MVNAFERADRVGADGSVGVGVSMGVPVTVAGGPAPTSVHVAPPLRFTVCSAAELTARTWTAYVVSFARSLMV